MSINPFSIIKQVEIKYKVPPGTITGGSRDYLDAEARAIAMFLVRKLTPYSLRVIGQHFNRTHNTVLHNCNKIEKIIQDNTNSNMINFIKALESNNFTVPLQL